MNPRIRRTQRDYTLAFKLTVVEQVEKGELTCKQAKDRYGIQGRSTVLVWLRKYGRQDRRDGASSAPCLPNPNHCEVVIFSTAQAGHGEATARAWRGHGCPS